MALIGELFNRIGELLGWLFHTRVGVGVLQVIGVVICGVAAAMLERRSRELYYDHGDPDDESDESGWNPFDDNSDDTGE